MKTPIHSLGISSILAYGWLYYAFAKTAGPLAEQYGITQPQVMLGLSAALLLEGFAAPWIGRQIDRAGALRCMAFGFAAGAIAMAILWIGRAPGVLYLGLLLVGVAHGFTTYTASFAAAIQLNPDASRRSISFITFYGAVASSIIWVTTGALLTWGGLALVFGVSGSLLAMASVVFALLARRHQPPETDPAPLEPFRWSLLTGPERRAMVLMAGSSSVDYFVFAGVTLAFIEYFTLMTGSATTGVLLASLYGPFQLVGRFLEMRYGSQIDARKTGLMAFVLNPIALALTLAGDVYFAALAMVLFGMANGVLTVTLGYVTHMYFRPQVYGRARGWINVPQAMGSALGPSIAAALLAWIGTDFMWFFVICAMVAAGIFVGLLSVATRPDMKTA